MADLNIHIRVSPAAVCLGLGGLLLFAVVPELATENLTLNTYYPAPSGVYAKMITTQDAYLARDGGNVGIGTSAPQQKLHVQGGQARFDGAATVGGALNVGGTVRIGNAAADPAGGAVGTIYYNTSTNKFRGYSSAGWQDLGATSAPIVWNPSATGWGAQGAWGPVKRFVVKANASDIPKFVILLVDFNINKAIPIASVPYVSLSGGVTDAGLTQISGEHGGNQQGGSAKQVWCPTNPDGSFFLKQQTGGDNGPTHSSAITQLGYVL